MSKKNKVKISPGDVAFKTIVMIILVVYATTILFLVFWGLINSFKADALFYENALSFPKLPIRIYEIEDYNKAWSIGNYIKIFEEFTYHKSLSYSSIFADEVVSEVTTGFFGMLGNTLYMALFCSFAQVIVCYVTGYLAAKYKFKFSGFIYGLVIAMMSIPVIGNQPSLINVLMKLNLFSNYVGIFFMKAAFGGMYFLVFYAFFEGLPDSYTEAAEIDGASQFRILLKIIVPMGMKMIGTVTLLLFVANWNDYSMSFIYMPTIPTLAYGIYELAHLGNKHAGFTGIVYKIAGCFLLIIPTLILFIAAKDKIMGNISAGGLKG